MHTFGNKSEAIFAGLSGTFGSGKDTAARHLVEQRGLMHMSTGDVCRAEATRLGLDHDRTTLVEIAIGLRQSYGGSIGALVLKGIEQWHEQKEDYQGGLVISGLRIFGEVQVVKEKKGTLLFVDAPPAVRYERILQRAIDEGRTVELAHIQCLEDFMESEKIELEGLGGPERPHLRAVESVADAVIQNTGSRTDFLRNIDTALGY